MIYPNASQQRPIKGKANYCQNAIKANPTLVLNELKSRVWCINILFIKY